MPKKPNPTSHQEPTTQTVDLPKDKGGEFLPEAGSSAAQDQAILAFQPEADDGYGAARATTLNEKKLGHLDELLFDDGFEAVRPKHLKEGMLIHFDTDNEDWGRVAEDGIVAETPSAKAKKILVNALGIRACIRVPLADISILSIVERDA